MKNVGEKKYKTKFELLETTPSDMKDRILDYLYKTSYNLADAYLYLELLIVAHDTDKSRDPYDAKGRVFLMSAISFSVALRKIVDRPSMSNLRRLVKALPREQGRKLEREIDGIYSKYKEFIETIIVHQGIGELIPMPNVPDYPEMKQDLDRLTEMYYIAANRFCRRYLPIINEHPKDTDNFRALLSK